VAKAGLRNVDVDCVAPAQIMDNETAGVKTYKEAWDKDRCIHALRTVGVYEAAAPGPWFQTSEEEVAWGGEVVLNLPVTYRELELAKTSFTDSAFQKSSDKPEQRRYSWPATIPTAILGEKEAEVTRSNDFIKDTPWFSNLPLLAGRAIFLGWFCAIDLAIEAENWPKVLKLWEA